MSWLISDLANKAEALLDKVDQTAATALQENGNPNETHTVHIGDLPSLPREQPIATHHVTSSGHSQATAPGTHHLNRSLPGDFEATHARGGSAGGGTVAPIPRPSVPRVSSVPSLKKREVEDQKLFEFLNSGPAATDSHIRNSNSPSPVPIQQTSSLNSVTATEGKQQQVASVVPSTETGVTIAGAPPPVPAVATLQQVSSIASAEPPKNAAQGKAEVRISQLELENKLLKTEVATLGEEAANALQTLKRAQHEMANLQARERHAQDQAAQLQRIASSASAKEHDHDEALKAKDSQLAVLRVRIQEADAELHNRSNLLHKVQGDNERILKDHSASSGLQGVALDEIRAKLMETEHLLGDEKDAHAKVQQDLAQARDRLQNEQQSSSLALKSLQVKLNEEKAKNRESARHVRSCSDSAESAQRELSDYKDKAAKILQAKERLILSLKGGNQDGDGLLPKATEAELYDACQERDSLREEVHQMRYRMEQLKTELRDNDHRHQMEADEQLDQLHQLEASLDEQRAVNAKLNDSLHASGQEIHYLQEDVRKIKTSQQKELLDRDAEIIGLKHQLAISSSTTSSQQELEGRVHSLTDSLIQKQTLVEALSTEKNSLVLQLERLEQQYRTVQDSLSRQLNLGRSGETSTGYEREDNEVSRSGSIASIMPMQIQNSTRVKSTVNEIDRFSIRLGRLLRRYPAARLFVILYMVILHVWVTIVLLTYQPEVHHPGDAMPRPPS